MQNIFLTFDVEDWHHSNWRSLRGATNTASTSIDYEVDKLIEICALTNSKSTCFVLGCLAKEKPHLIKKLHHAGHEIASHGSDHKLVYNMNRTEFHEDIKRSIDTLEDIIGDKIFGFRAPSWSIKTENQNWYYEELYNLGLRYSSSVYPAYTYLYGVPNAPKKPHKVQTNDGYIIEIPVPVTCLFGRDVGYSGGFYLRFFPLWFIKRCIRKADDGIFLYLHPREINKNQQKLQLNWLEHFIAYYGINTCSDKLIKLIDFTKNNQMLMKNYEI